MESESPTISDQPVKRGRGRPKGSKKKPDSFVNLDEQKENPEIPVAGPVDKPSISSDNCPKPPAAPAAPAPVTPAVPVAVAQPRRLRRG